jgi:hypothetical protein
MYLLFLDNIDPTVSLKKHSFSETGFYFRLQFPSFRHNKANIRQCTSQSNANILISLIFYGLQKHLKVGCLHPVACTRSGSGFPSNATLV